MDLELEGFRVLNVDGEVCRLDYHRFLNHHILCVFSNVCQSLGSGRGTMDRAESRNGNVMRCCLGYDCCGLETISIA